MEVGGAGRTVEAGPMIEGKWMTELQKTAKQAQRRLWLNRWLAGLGWSLAAAAGLFILAVAIERTLIAGEGTGRFFGRLALGLAGLALVASLIWVALTRDSLARAAARLDLAAGLKERISSGLYCEKASDPFARAVVADATRASRGISGRDQLPVQIPPSAPYAGGTLVIALLFFWLFPTLDLAGKQEQRQQEEQQRQLVERSRAIVQPVLKRQVQQLRDKHPALRKELEELEPLKDARLEKPRDVLREPIKQINKVGEKLDRRRNTVELAKIEEFKKLARRLAAHQQSKSPVGQLAKALASGDFKSAQDVLEAIQAKLTKTPQTEEESKQAEELRKQLERLSAKLEQAARSNRKNREDLAQAGLTDQEIKQAIKNLRDRDLQAVEKMLADKGLSQEQINKLMQQMKKRCAACSMASKLAQNLGQAAQGRGGAGQLSQSAMAGLSAAGAQLSDMESLEQELNQLNSAVSDLQAMKDQLGQGCPACGGTGMKDGLPCGMCQGTGLGCRGPGMGKLGQGQGNIAPEQATRFKTVRERTRVNTLPGTIIDMQFVNGQQFSGPVSDEFVEAAIARQREVQDAIAREQLPRVYHKSLQRYFDHSLDDLPADKVKAAQNKAGPEKPDAGAE